jgi:hypothetical protein
MQNLIPFVRRAFDEKYSKKAIDNPKRVACGLCLDVTRELGHLYNTVWFEACDYFGVKSDHSGGIHLLRERLLASDRLYNRIVSYFENEEWEERRPQKKTPVVQNKKIVNSLTEFPGLGA